jgi:hypothetical protein
MNCPVSLKFVFQHRRIPEGDRPLFAAWLKSAGWTQREEWLAYRLTWFTPSGEMEDPCLEPCVWIQATREAMATLRSRGWEVAYGVSRNGPGTELAVSRVYRKGERARSFSAALKREGLWS